MKDHMKCIHVTSVKTESATKVFIPYTTLIYYISLESYTLVSNTFKRLSLPFSILASSTNIFLDILV